MQVEIFFTDSANSIILTSIQIEFLDSVFLNELIDAGGGILIPYELGINRCDLEIMSSRENFARGVKNDNYVFVKTLYVAWKLRCGERWMSEAKKIGLSEDVRIGRADMFDILRVAPLLADVIPHSCILNSIPLIKSNVDFVEIMRSYRAIAKNKKEILCFNICDESSIIDVKIAKALVDVQIASKGDVGGLVVEFVDPIVKSFNSDAYYFNCKPIEDLYHYAIGKSSLRDDDFEAIIKSLPTKYEQIRRGEPMEPWYDWSPLYDFRSLRHIFDQRNRRFKIELVWNHMKKSCIIDFTWAKWQRKFMRSALKAFKKDLLLYDDPIDDYLNYIEFLVNLKGYVDDSDFDICWLNDAWSKYKYEAIRYRDEDVNSMNKKITERLQRLI